MSPITVGELIEASHFLWTALGCVAPRLPPAQCLHLIDPTVSPRLREEEAGRGRSWARTKAATLGPEDGSWSRTCHPSLPPSSPCGRASSRAVILGLKMSRGDEKHHPNPHTLPPAVFKCVRKTTLCHHFAFKLYLMGS